MFRSWDRVYVVVKGPELLFYYDQTVYKTTGETFRGEKPLSLTGGSADGAADYDKKIHVFRVRLVRKRGKNIHRGVRDPSVLKAKAMKS